MSDDGQEKDDSSIAWGDRKPKAMGKKRKASFDIAGSPSKRTGRLSSPHKLEPFSSPGEGTAVDDLEYDPQAWEVRQGNLAPKSLIGFESRDDASNETDTASREEDAETDTKSVASNLSETESLDHSQVQVESPSVQPANEASTAAAAPASSARSQSASKSVVFDLEYNPDSFDCRDGKLTPKQYADGEPRLMGTEKHPISVDGYSSGSEIDSAPPVKLRTARQKRRQRPLKSYVLDEEWAKVTTRVGKDYQADITARENGPWQGESIEDCGEIRWDWQEESTPYSGGVLWDPQMAQQQVNENGMVGIDKFMGQGQGMFPLSDLRLFVWPSCLLLTTESPQTPNSRVLLSIYRNEYNLSVDGGSTQQPLQHKRRTEMLF